MTRALRPSRRALLAGAVALVACSKTGADARCELCGMKLDPASPWRAELVATDGKTHSFDTPRCALTALRKGKVAGSGAAVRVQEFYDRTWVAGTEVDFVVGSDVIGPMGPDLVPVGHARAAKFVKDHGDGRALALDAVTPDAMDAIK